MASVTDEDKKLLISRLTDLKWKDDLSCEFQCKRCDQVLIHHYISQCGHKFCLKCKNILDDGSNKCKCPLCLEVVQEIKIQDFEFEKKVYENVVHCANTKYGCLNIIKLKELPNHLKLCKYKEKDILLNISKGNKKLDAVLTQMETPNSRIQKEIEEGAKNNRIEIENLKLVMEKKINQNQTFVEEKIEQLKNDVALLTENSDSEDLKNRVTQMESNIQFMKLQMQPSSLSDDLWQREAAYTWHVTNLKKLMIKGTFEIKSKSFKLPNYHVSAEAKLELDADDKLNLELCLTSPFKTSDSYAIPPAVYYVVKCQNGSEDRDIVFHTNYPYPTNLKDDYQEAYFSYLFNKEKAINSIYNVEDTLIIEIYVEPPDVVSEALSDEGTLLWAIDNYKKRKEMEDDELVEYQLSPYFYTAPHGYRVQAFIYLNGDEKFEGKGLTFEIAFLHGEFDNDLPDSFPHKTTITIINPAEPSKSFTKSVIKNHSNDDNFFYNVNMCQFADIEKLAKNDTLIFKIQIQSI